MLIGWVGMDEIDKYTCANQSISLMDAFLH